MILPVAVPFGIFIGLLVIIYLALSTPLRRQERARLFLDLLEDGLRDGQSPEHTIVDISHAHDRTLGPQFHLLAAHIEAGMRLRQALSKVPNLVPRRVAAMLRQYEHVDSLPSILSACRRLLTDASSQSMMAVNYVICIFLLSSPAWLFIPVFFAVRIFPRFKEITEDMGVKLPPAMTFCLQHSIAILIVQVGVLVAVCVAAFTSGVTGRAFRWLDPVVKPIGDRLMWRLPWRRKRLLWGFSELLAVFLDEDVSEAKAVQLAAAGTDNRVFMRLGDRIVERLQQGVPLTEAITALDDRGEFRWRLANAAYAHGGFRAALAGWQQGLDAKAFQEEQAASQIITTALVILNGALVALIAFSVFQALTSIVWVVSLW
jgi:type II secretory pathway component PulF